MPPSSAGAQPRPKAAPPATDEPPPPEEEDRPDDGPAPASPAPAAPAEPAPEPAPEAPRDVPVETQPLGYTEAFKWVPFGFVRLQYIATQNDPNVPFVGRDDGFQLQNARVGVRGQLRSKAAFVVSFDGAVDEREQINVPQGQLRVGLRDAFVDVALGDRLPWDAATPKLIARAGFFQTWVEPENQVPDTLREFVDRPIESRGIRANEGFQTQGLTPGRSLGVAVRLQPQFLPANVGGGFELAVQNGADEFSSNNDNDKPAVSASGLVRLHNGTFLVASARYNPRSVGELPFRQDEDDLQGSVGARLVAGPIAIGAAAVFVRTAYPTTGGPSQNAVGAHGQLVFRAGSDKLPLGVGYRFGFFDPSSLIVTDRVMEHTVGGYLGVPSYRMRVQLQLTHVIEQAARALSNSRAQLAVEVAL